MPQWAQRTMDSTGSSPGRRAGVPAPLDSRRLAARDDTMRAIIRTARMTMTQSNNLPTSAPMQYDFEYEPAAGIGQDQESEARQRPAQRHGPAPPPDMAPEQQYAEGQP